MLNKFTITLIISVMIMRSAAVTGQDKSQYLLHNIPQTINLNPAVWYSCRTFIALPGISEISGYYRNNAFAYNETFTSRADAGGDSLLFNPEMLSSTLGKRNNIRFGSGVALGGFGFNHNDWFFSVFVSNRAAFRFTFSRDIMDALDGNFDLASNEPRPVNLDGTGIHFIDYTELAFGASKKIQEGLYIGGRAKFLLGAGHLQTRKSRLNLTTTTSPIELYGTSSFQLRGSLPVNIILNRDGLVSRVESPVQSVYDLPRYLLSGNYGLAIDGGIIYEYTDRLTLSASVNDLGFIWWRKNINVLDQAEQFVFNGFNLNSYIQGGTDTDILQALEDSVTSNFRLSSSHKPYVALVPARFLAGAEYELNSQVSLGAVAETEILSGRFYPGLTITATARPVDPLTFSLTYSLMDRAADNIGFALVAGERYVQFYIVSDHIPLRYVKDSNSGMVWPYSARTMNVRLGINVILDCPGDKRPDHRRSGRNKYCPAYR